MRAAEASVRRTLIPETLARMSDPTKFYEALGFQKLLDAGSAVIFGAGSGGFVLQRRYQNDWAESSRRSTLGASDRAPH